MYYVFVGGMVKGDLFPQFRTEGATIVGTTAPADMAKLIVFAFVAGFAERLVPDVLDRLAAGTDEPGKAKEGKAIG